MRDVLVIVGAALLFLLVAVPWFSIYDWVRRARGKKYKSREGVI